MATTPRWKVFDDRGEYVASCKYPSDAAALVGLRTSGATVRDGHRVVVFEQGRDGDAGESYDLAALLIQIRARLADKGRHLTDSARESLVLTAIDAVERLREPYGREA